MRKTLLFIALLVNVLSFAQRKETDSYSRGYVSTLSKSDFDKIVDSCMSLINSKKYNEITDSGFIFIIACDNTIMFNHHVKNPEVLGHRFEGGIYMQFLKATITNEFNKALQTRFPDNTSRNEGAYFAH